MRRGLAARTDDDADRSTRPGAQVLDHDVGLRDDEFPQAAALSDPFRSRVTDAFCG